jgi:hypothetical protein
MNRLIVLTLVACASLFAAEPADAVKQASTGWRQAAIKKDTAGLQRFLADDLAYSHADGRTQTKAEYIASVTSNGRYESFTESGTDVRVYGRAAVLRGFVDVKLTNQPAYRVLTLEVYVENNGQWQMTAHQSVRINPNARQ